jgi:hypothetical protein
VSNVDVPAFRQLLVADSSCCFIVVGHQQAATTELIRQRYDGTGHIPPS